MKNKQPKLYWVETYDHDDDWFAVAYNPMSAKKLHSRFYEYYFDEDELRDDSIVKAIPVSPISEKTVKEYIDVKLKNHGIEAFSYSERPKNKQPSLLAFYDAFVEAGAIFLNKDYDKGPISVLINGVIYTEGSRDYEWHQDSKILAHFTKMEKNFKLN